MGLAAWHEAQLKRLFFQEYAALLAYARGALGGTEIAEEAVQQAFRIACDRPDALLKSRSPGGWLMRTLQNVIRNQLRTQQRWAQLLSDQPMEQLQLRAPQDEPGWELQYRDLIDPEDYALFRRIALDGCTVAEAAQELGITVEACKKRVQRARLALRKKIEESEK